MSGGRGGGACVHSLGESEWSSFTNLAAAPRSSRSSRTIRKSRSRGGAQVSARLRNMAGVACTDAATVKYISQEEARAIDQELYDDYGFSQEQLVELMGLACAHAIAKVYPVSSLPRKQRTVLVACGPGKNGACGLVCARHLKMFEFEPSIYYPKRPCRPLCQALTTQCEKLDIPFLSYLPMEVQLINDAYFFVVDAIFGSGFTGQVLEPFVNVINTLQQLRTPIISIDIPSGWPVDNVPVDGLSPTVLVSLGAPKVCSQHFSGKYHFVAGRYLPPDILRKYELNLPDYPDVDCVVSVL